MGIRFATASVLMLAALSAPSVPAQVANPRVYSPQRSADAPQIDLWLDQVNIRAGDRISPHFVTEPGAYVTIIRVTTDGQLQVLYPLHPRDQRPFERSALVNDRVPYNSFDRRNGNISESGGIGFVFAIASFDRFDYSYFNSAGLWSVARLANDSRYGDPFEIARRFVDRTLDHASDFSMDYVSYEVDNYGARSRYASRYGYSALDDYYDECLSAFGNRYSLYCRDYYPGFGPIFASRPRNGTPGTPPAPTGNYAHKRIWPVVGDPLVHGAPSEPQVATEGRLPNRNPAEEAAAGNRRERMLRNVSPRDRSAPNVDTRPMEREPRIYSAPPREPAPRSEPRIDPRIEQPRIERPRIEPRIEQRAEPRSEPVTPARVEIRNEPAPMAMPMPAPRMEPAPRPVSAPVQKDNSN